MQKTVQTFRFTRTLHQTKCYKKVLWGESENQARYFSLSIVHLKKVTAILKPFISNVHIFVILLCFVFIKILMEDIFASSWRSWIQFPTSIGRVRKQFHLKSFRGHRILLQPFLFSFCKRLQNAKRAFRSIICMKLKVSDKYGWHRCSIILSHQSEKPFFSDSH